VCVCLFVFDECLSFFPSFQSMWLQQFGGMSLMNVFQDVRSKYWDLDFTQGLHMIQDLEVF
jgi:hypothetical protein